MEMIVQAPNWELLKEQKETLLKIIFKPKDYPNLTTKDIENIEGLVNFFDYIQDKAVDECGVPESEAFTTEDDQIDSIL